MNQLTLQYPFTLNTKQESGKKTRKKVFFISHLSDNKTFKCRSFANTELRKYILQQIVSCNLTGDLSQMMQRSPDIQRQ